MRIATLISLSLILGCNAPEPTKSVTAQAQAPAASKPPLLKTKTKVDVQDDPEIAKDPQVSWFEGIEDLPDGHPCRDDAVVVRMDYECDGPAGLVVLTLGELKEDESIHLGARTVQGARWSDDDNEYMIVSCDLNGLGFRPISNEDEEQFAEIGESSHGAPWIEIDFGEPSLFEKAFVHWMSKPKRGTEWTVERMETRSSSHDHGKNPQYSARSSIVEIGDFDQDGFVESTVMLVGDCASCPTNDEQWRRFTIDLYSKSNAGERQAKVSIDHSGKQLNMFKMTGPEHRGVKKGLAILRDKKALR